jgi:hypothetical protein
MRASANCVASSILRCLKSLYQGTTSVVPQPPKIHAGFSP